MDVNTKHAWGLNVCTQWWAESIGSQEDKDRGRGKCLKWWSKENCPKVAFVSTFVIDTRQLLSLSGITRSTVTFCLNASVIEVRRVVTSLSYRILLAFPLPFEAKATQSFIPNNSVSGSFLDIQIYFCSVSPLNKSQYFSWTRFSSVPSLKHLRIRAVLKFVRWFPIAGPGLSGCAPRTWRSEE